MELNLRKARKLEAAIQEHLDSSRVSATATVRVLGSIEDAKASMKAAREEALKSLPVREELLRLRYSIRRQIEMANEATGINKLMNEKVLTDALSKDLQNSGVVAGHDDLTFQDTFESQVALYKAPADQYNRHKSTTFHVNSYTKADADVVAKARLEHKKRIEAIEDQIGEKNIIGKVTLTDGDLKLLESVGLK